MPDLPKNQEQHPQLTPSETPLLARPSELAISHQEPPETQTPEPIPAFTAPEHNYPELTTTLIPIDPTIPSPTLEYPGEEGSGEPFSMGELLREAPIPNVEEQSPAETPDRKDTQSVTPKPDSEAIGTGSNEIEISYPQPAEASAQTEESHATASGSRPASVTVAAVDLLPASVEKSAPALLEIAIKIDTLATAIAAGSESVQDSDSATRTVLNAVGVWDTLEEHASDIGGVAQVVGALNQLDETTHNDDPWAVRVISEVPGKAFLDSLRELADTKHPVLFETLERAVDEAPLSLSAEEDLMYFVEHLVRQRYGSMSEWVQRPPKDLPPFLLRLSERPYFAQACLKSELASITHTRSRIQQIQLARTAERTILERILGVTAQQSEEFRLAIEGRTVKRDDYGNALFMREGGGLETEDWYMAMKGFIDNYTALGSEQVKLIRDDWGIVNLDRYTPAQLTRMALLSKKDPKLLNHLRSNDVRLLLSDRYGDRLGAAPQDIAALENSETLFAEAGNPHGLYLPPVRLKQVFGVIPCEIDVVAHGTTEGLYFGLLGRREGMGMAFEVGITDPEMIPVDIKRRNPIDITKTRVGRLLHDYMQPSRKTGKRLVGLLVCFQAEPPKYTKLSTVEALARAADVQDEVVVVGYDGELSYEKKLGLWDPVRNRPARMLAFQRMSSTAVQITTDFSLETYKPVE